MKDPVLAFDVWLRSRPNERKRVTATTWIEAKRLGARAFRTAVENVDAEIVKGFDENG